MEEDQWEFLIKATQSACKSGLGQKRNFAAFGDFGLHIDIIRGRNKREESLKKSVSKLYGPCRAHAKCRLQGKCLAVTRDAFWPLGILV